MAAKMLKVADSDSGLTKIYVSTSMAKTDASDLKIGESMASLCPPWFMSSLLVNL